MPLVNNPKTLALDGVVAYLCAFYCTQALDIFQGSSHILQTTLRKV